MTTLTSHSVDRRQLGATIVPIIVIALTGVAVRTPLATAHPFVALLLFLWIVADTMMLSLVVRSPGRPEWNAILGVLAGASFVTWLGSPPAVRTALLATPLLVVVLAVIVLSHVAWASIRAHRIATSQDVDRPQRWASAASEIFPPVLVRLAIAEMAVINMALFRWGGPADVPANARAFAYHKHLTPICAALLILSAIEIAVYHLLVGHWSRTAALVMFVVSDMGFVYLVGLIKSFRYRPVLLTPEGVRVRAGFLIDQLVPFDAIAAVDGDVTGEEVRAPATLNAALLAWPNVMLRLRQPQPRRALLKRQSFTCVAFRLDDPERFIRLLDWRLGQHNS